MGDNKRKFLEGDLEKELLRVRADRFIKNDHIPGDLEIQVLQEALESSQYRHKLRWCIEAIRDADIFPVRMPSTGTTCYLCGKDIMYWSTWEAWATENPGFEETTYRNHLAFGVRNSRRCFCLDCVTSLRILST